MAKSEPQTIEIRSQNNGLQRGTIEAACDFQRL